MPHTDYHRQTAGNGRRTARDESSLERLDRNQAELIQELRVLGTGIQVLFAFLLVVPFNSGFARLSSFDRDVYFAAALLITPTIHHRLLFRRREKEYMVGSGNRLAIVAVAFLCAGLTGILLLISHVMFGTAAAATVGALTGLGLSALWFGVPLSRR